MPNTKVRYLDAVGYEIVPGCDVAHIKKSLRGCTIERGTVISVACTCCVQKPGYSRLCYIDCENLVVVPKIKLKE